MWYTILRFFGMGGIGVFNEIQKFRTSVEIINQIISSISKGKLLPGSPLPSERELAKMFNVSRVVVREAISGLALLGIVEKKWGKGNFISDNINFSLIHNSIKHLVVLKEQEMMDVLEARIAVECELAALAAKRRTDEDLFKLKSALDNYLKGTRGTLKKLELDLAFHGVIAEVGRSKVLEGLQRVLSEKCISVMQFGAWLKDIVKSAEGDHIQIYEAIREGNPAKAQEAMRLHLNKLMDRVSFCFDSIDGKDKNNAEAHIK
ncbi:MAG: Transcriptional regulator [Thermotoga petrophila]|uniref:Transcriptional regulator n=1 Tax=Thermotoga petrophila TaxID=93929 RepID=A0A101EQM1_9THEM|nr:MAG: Transcriptional regulator [Thermotoga petrophila]